VRLIEAWHGVTAPALLVPLLTAQQRKGGLELWKGARQRINEGVSWSSARYYAPCSPLSPGAPSAVLCFAWAVVGKGQDRGVAEKIR